MNTNNKENMKEKPYGSIEAVGHLTDDEIQFFEWYYRKEFRLKVIIAIETLILLIVILRYLLI